MHVLKFRQCTVVSVRVTAVWIASGSELRWVQTSMIVHTQIQKLTHTQTHIHTQMQRLTHTHSLVSLQVMPIFDTMAMELASVQMGTQEEVPPIYVSLL